MTTTCRRPTADVSARGMMAKAGASAASGGKKKGGKGGGGGGDGAKDSAGEHGLGVTPINFLKDGKDPSVMPDEEYPEWLWNMQVCMVCTILTHTRAHLLFCSPPYSQENVASQ